MRAIYSLLLFIPKEGRWIALLVSLGVKFTLVRIRPQQFVFSLLRDKVFISFVIKQSRLGSRERKQKLLPDRMTLAFLNIKLNIIHIRRQLQTITSTLKIFLYKIDQICFCCTYD